MSSVTSATDSTRSATDATSASTVRTPTKTLSQQDFLQLLSQQLQSQDPLQPMDDTSFLAQMAQFTSLQQMSSLSSEITLMRGDQQKLAASTYLGRNVTLDDGNQGTVSGCVTSVNTAGDVPQLEVNGIFYPLSSLISVDATSPADQPAA
ncbi:MAG: flagellar hook capping FlgD N-terminal domain-containing protein [Opitutaceae bacterium]|nr:flagellar hook capping FlgD N-terminal domain-containing protein [Opitutaceae bacterium]